MTLPPSIRRAAFLLAALAALWPTPGAAQAPPSQPDTRIPAVFVDAARFLFDHGMGDPRGGEFRKVTVAFGKPAEVTGWVFYEGGKPARVVCWNGLAYKPIEVGEKLDLGAFVERSLVGPRFTLHDAITMAYWANCPASLPGVALLLRVNEPELAGRVYAVRRSGRSGDAGAPIDAGQLVGAYAWARYTRAAVAHLCRDDLLARSDSRLLVANSDAMRELAARWAAPGLQRSPPLWLATSLQLADELAVDSARRLSHLRPSPSHTDALARLPLHERVPRLIDLLDEEGADGSAGAAQAYPAIASLIDIGDPAVDALLTCVENDTRLTRAPRPSMSAGGDLRLLSVRQVASQALTQILSTEDLRRGPDGVIEVAAVRAQWLRDKALSPAERYYRVLLDNNAGERRWIEAARLLVRRSDDGGAGRSRATAAASGKPRPPMVGESLRSSKQPSIGDLMVRRVAQIAAAPSASTTIARNYAAARAVCMGALLGRWDRQGSRDALREIDRSGRAALQQGAGGIHDVWLLAHELASLTCVRLRAGDVQAVADYAGWVQTVDLSGSGVDEVMVAMPLVQFPDLTRELSARIFSSATSPLSPRFTPPGSSGPRLCCILGVVESPLIQVDAFRECVLALLADRRVLGTAWVDGEGASRFQGKDGSSGGLGVDGAAVREDSALPPSGTKRPLRVCDAAAVALRRYAGAPEYFPCWSDAARDAAIEKLKAFVIEKGAGLAELHPKDAFGWKVPFPD